MKRAAAWVLLALNGLAAIALAVMTILHTARAAEAATGAALIFMAMSFVVVGGLLALRRPGPIAECGRRQIGKSGWHRDRYESQQGSHPAWPGRWGRRHLLH